MDHIRRLVAWLVALGLAAAAGGAQAAPVYYVDFNQAAGPAPASYVASPDEALPAGTTMTRRGTPSLEAAPLGPGAEGGSALRTIPGSGSQGYAISGGPNLTGSFTAEAVIQADSINPAGNVAGLQDILNAEGTSHNNILRVDSTGQVHLYPMYNTGGGTNPTSRIASAGAINPGHTYHVAAVWDQAAEQAELLINGVSQGTLSRAGHTGPTFGGAFAVSNNHNTAYNPRNLDGLMDAFAVSDAALTTDQLALKPPPAYLLTFDQGVQSPAPSPYAPGPDEMLPPGATMTVRGTPSLVTTPSDGVRQGGEALATSAGSTHQGYQVTGGGSITGSHTLEMIFQANALNPNTSGLQDLVNSEGAGADKGQTILRIASSGKLEYYSMYSGGGTNATSKIDSRVPIITGQLQHVAAVFDDATDTAALYLNGVPQGTLSRADYTALSTFSNSFGIATHNGGAHANRSLEGTVDALAVTAQALPTSQFVYAHLPMAGYDFAPATGGGLFVQPAAGDLIAGKTPAANVAYSGGMGTWAVLTDGAGTNGHPEMSTRVLPSDSATSPTNPCELTYTLDSPAKLTEVRVFTQNPDGRVWQDYDVEVSFDGQTWTMMKDNVRNGIRGVSVNDWGDASVGDWSATAVRRLDSAPMTDYVNHVRFTLREVGASSGLFAAEGASTYNSMLYEIDVLGEATASLQKTAVGGGYRAPHLGGGPGIVDGNPATVGYIDGTWPPGAGQRDGGQFGADFGGVSEVMALAITQDGAEGGSGFRDRVKDVTVHFGDGRTCQLTLADQYGRQVVMLPQAVTTSYLLLTADSLYTDGSTDPNAGIVEFEVFGSTPVPDTNHNLGILPVVVGPLGSHNHPERATDGILHTNANSTDYSTFFRRNSGRDSVTVTYGELLTIGSIGIGWAPDTTPSGLRDMPRFVTLETDSGLWDIPVDDLIQYMRYDLPSPVPTTFARLLFPDGSNVGDWYLHNDANYGITEFQAFQAALVPEPASLALLGLGALALLRRRRRG